MRLAVQQLFSSSVTVDLCTRTPQDGQEKMPVGLGECRGFGSFRDESLGLCRSFHEVRRGDLDATESCVQAVERVSVLGW